MVETAVKGADVKAEMELSLAENKGALVAIAENRSSEDQARIKDLMNSIDITNVNSIIEFGVDAQGGLSKQSDAMMKGVRNKDVGPVGEVMNGLMVQIRGLGLESLNPNEKPGFFAKLMSKLTPLQKFVQQYESIESQVDAMVSKLDGHKTQLGRDVVMLDKMYDEALKFFGELALYIEAGELKLADLRANDIPALQAALEASTGNEAMLKANELRDLNERVLDLERKVNDLMLTRTATMQMLPQLRMIQDVDKGLVTKIQSSIMVTIPVWKNQIAMSIALWNQAGAIKTQTAVADATNEMMRKTSEQLKMNSADARREMERGVIDIDTLKTVNANLIATIVEAGQIAEQGKKARIAAQAEMVKCEADLKEALKSSAAKAVGVNAA